MKSFKVLIEVLYGFAIVFQLVFLIWRVESTSLIGFFFLLLASVNMLVYQVKLKQKEV
jgi:hypothetical protein